MKKVFVFLVVAVMCFSLCACQTAEEREYEKAKARAEAMEDAYKKQQDKYDQLLNDIEAYKNAVDKLNN